MGTLAWKGAQILYIFSERHLPKWHMTALSQVISQTVQVTYVSFHGILVADELICHNFGINDAILTQLGRIHLWEVPHP